MVNQLRSFDCNAIERAATSLLTWHASFNLVSTMMRYALGNFLNIV